jgi:prophage tail gpP-like protein
MSDASETVILCVAGVEYGGWTAIPSIRSGMDTIAGGFQVALTEKWPGSAYRPIRKEDDVELWIGDDIVIKGQVDEVAREIDAGTHTITITGRDATADLVDCAAMNSPGEWKERGLADIAADICAPFGIKVETAPGTDLGKPFPGFTLQKGEKAVAAIQRMCASRGVLPYSDGRGILVLGPGTPARVATRLVEGDNIKKAGAKDSRIGRFRDYTVYAQSGQWGDAAANAGTKGEAHDGEMRRYRPIARMADDLADGITAADQAAWDAMIAKAKAMAAEVTVRGWRHAGGLWRPNTLVTVKAPSIQLDGDRLIASVDRCLDDQGGTIAKLSLVGPHAFDLLAEKQKGAVAW